MFDFLCHWKPVIGHRNMMQCRLISFVTANILYFSLHQILITSCLTTDAFSIRPTFTLKSSNSLNSILSATRKRRRKDESSESSPDNSNSNNILPDFDLDEDEEIVGATETSAVKKSTKKSAGSISNEISPNMMGSAGKPVRSISDLIADRSLEQKMDFDMPISDVVLPDLAVVARSDDSDQGPSSVMKSNRKKERQLEARRLASIAAEKEKEDEERMSLLNALPGIRDESGKVSAVKILETGTWACIYTLVAWEIYINTPLFDRAAPMAPIVY